MDTFYEGIFYEKNLHFPESRGSFPWTGSTEYASIIRQRKTAMVNRYY